MKAILVLLCSCLLLVGCMEWARGHQKELKDGAGTIGSFFGIPRTLTEGLVGLILYAGAHQHGKRGERRRNRTAVQKAVPDGR